MEKEYKNYSILMSVYSNEKPEYLVRSIESMLSQTLKTNDFVIVEDGKLSEELNKILDEYSSKYNEIKLIKLNENVGLGKALDYGLQYCRNELVARMDADDISLSTRCERLMELFNQNEKLSIAGTNIDEFFDDPNVVYYSRVVPTTDKEIKKYIKRRSPFNHPSVMYKKSEVIRCGGYGPLKRKQDMDLFSRMMNMDCVAQNIPESLLLFRANANSMKRRKSREYRKSTIVVAKLNYKRGYISFWDLTYIRLGQFLMRILPSKSLNKLLRKKAKNK